MTHHKIQKQFDHIQDKKVRSIVIDWSRKEISQKARDLRKLVTIAHQHFSKELEFFPNGMYIVSGACIELFAKIRNALLDLESLFMDMYMMGRCLRTFEDGSEPENIIIYVGDLHAKTYKRLLKKKLNAEMIQEVHGKDSCERDSCVNVSSLLSNRKNDLNFQRGKRKK